ncbi:hypothetical protein ARMA_0912 [Ardenticatena maritima]|uniref:Uncharacterized protein n=1 Tax=Ardenticatena maritima TaxID=872965 RepID=A0A0M9UC56_9CHLR|nr:hypothetical protein ARMA_0912 [Ardenticatena maritima]
MVVKNGTFSCETGYKQSGWVDNTSYGSFFKRPIGWCL